MNNEPVAWINEDNFLLGDVLNSAVYRTKPNEEFTIPLYTHPAKTLTDEEIEEIHEDLMQTNFWERMWPDFYMAFAKEILRKAQEK